MSNRRDCHVVWFKRDLRIIDHAPLQQACAAGTVLPVFIWSPTLWAAEDASLAQAGFVRECLHALAADLHSLGLQLHVYHLEPLQVFERLRQQHGMVALYSHEETGNGSSYAIDRAVLAWCKQHAIPWHETSQNGVVRRLKTRDRWQTLWERKMALPLQPLPAHASGYRLQHHGLHHLPVTTAHEAPARQQGGREQALNTLHSFFEHRVSNYRGGISSPRTAPVACSRLSPYLAWGVLSLREVVQQTRSRQLQATGFERKGLQAFESRLHWHCHFMQKLESEPDIEFRSFDTRFDDLRPHEQADSGRLQAWCQGQTGWPLVDACMRMLQTTGWLNFRMRAMLMSTASYLLWLPWRPTGLHLARLFVDYEPGIHWPQVQMQSGTTGINTLRIYHPVKQALALDAQGVFVRRWLPALRRVPDSWIFEPWRMPLALQQRYGCRIGTDYAAPCVEIGPAIQAAKQALHPVRHALAQSGAVETILRAHGSRASRHFPRRAAGSLPVSPAPSDGQGHSALRDVDQLTLPF